MYKRTLVFTCLFFGTFLLIGSFGFAQDKYNGFEAGNFKDSGGYALPYRIFVPQSYKKGNKYPLVLWLHGGQGRGTNNRRQLSGGNRIGSSIWTKPENQAKNPAFVLAPQLPRRTARTRDESVVEIKKNLETVVKLIESIKKEYSIDSDRVYVTGQSFGGYGTWWMITHKPEVFAAAVPICGGGEPEKVTGKRTVPVWAFHGVLDPTVPVERSREMIEAMKKTGGYTKITEYKDLGHVIWSRVFAEPGLLEWVFKQRQKK